MQNANLNNKTILITGGTDPILASLANKMKEVVYCNCDDPLASNFFLNFKHLWLKELITTCYKSQNFREFSAEEKNILSLYQAAKALCAYWCEMEFDKVSLLGDGIKNTDKNLRSKTEICIIE